MNLIFELLDHLESLQTDVHTQRQQFKNVYLSCNYRIVKYVDTTKNFRVEINSFWKKQYLLYHSMLWLLVSGLSNASTEGE